LQRNVHVLVLGLVMVLGSVPVAAGLGWSAPGAASGLLPRDVRVDGTVLGAAGQDLDIAARGVVTIAGSVVAASGAPGLPGSAVRIHAAEIRILPTASVRAGDGGAGLSVVGLAVAAGPGARGGDVVLDAPLVTVLGALAAGDGGRGGDAVGRQAVAGDGGDGGVVRIAEGAVVQGDFPEAGLGGAGGAARTVPDAALPSVPRVVAEDGIAILGITLLDCEHHAARGENARATAHKNGGDADATGGTGARGADGALVSDGCIADLNGDPGGQGGSAFAKAGNGGNGCPGGPGGDATATGGTGGRGGDALLLLVLRIGDGGDGGQGGDAKAFGGKGGNSIGGKHCTQPGGPGGDATATGGMGGDGGTGGCLGSPGAGGAGGDGSAKAGMGGNRGGAAGSASAVRGEDGAEGEEECLVPL